LVAIRAKKQPCPTRREPEQALRINANFLSPAKRSIYRTGYSIIRNDVQTPIHINTGVIMNSVRWNIAVSPEMDQSVRIFIAAQGGGRKGDLSKFIEEAVRSYLLERAAEQAKAAATGMSELELTDLIDEAVQWAREH